MEKEVGECNALLIAILWLKELAAAQVDEGELAARAKKLLNIVRGYEGVFRRVLKTEGVESFKAALRLVEEHGYGGLRSVSTTLRTYEAILREAGEAKCGKYVEEGSIAT